MFDIIWPLTIYMTYDNDTVTLTINDIDIVVTILISTGSFLLFSKILQISANISQYCIWNSNFIFMKFCKKTITFYIHYSVHFPRFILSLQSPSSRFPNLEISLLGHFRFWALQSCLHWHILAWWVTIFLSNTTSHLPTILRLVLSTQLWHWPLRDIWLLSTLFPSLGSGLKPT